jgi:hypothetical protein
MEGSADSAPRRAQEVPADAEDVLRALLEAHPEIDPEIKEAALKRVREVSSETRSF